MHAREIIQVARCSAHSLADSVQRLVATEEMGNRESEQGQQQTL